MLKKLSTAIAASGMALGGLAATAPTASAAGTCSLYVQSTVSIGQPYRAIPLKRGPNCDAAGVDFASWHAYHPTQGLVEVAYFDGLGASDTWNLYSWDTPLGKWSWRPEGAWNANYDPVFQYGPYTTDVRLGSYARVTTSRSGSKVTVRTTAHRYWGDGEKFIRWAGAKGVIQYRTAGSSTWRGLKNVSSTSTGTYSYSYTTNSKRYYRVVFPNVPTIWGSTSPAVYRS